MKAMLTLADAASHHPDGTLSLLRGGITEVSLPPERPPVFKGALVARIVGSESEAGKHEFRIACVTGDGGEVATPVTGEFEIPPEGGAAQIALSMQLALPAFGRYEFAMVVDESQVDVCPFEAKENRSDGRELRRDERHDPFAGEGADPADLADAARRHMKCPWPEEDW